MRERLRERSGGLEIPWLHDPNTGSASILLEGLNEFDNPGETIDSITPAVIPEPGSALLLLAGGVVFARRRRGAL